MTRIQANLALLLAAAIWGGGFVAQSQAMAHIGPNWFNALRFGLALCAILPFVWHEARRATVTLSMREWIGFTLAGLCLLAGQTAQQIGIQTTTVTNASFLTGLYVVLVPVISVLVLKRSPHWVIWPAALLSLVGIFFLSGGSLSALNGGDLLIILCALFIAGQIILTGLMVRLSGRPMALSAMQFAVCVIGATAAGAAVEPFDAVGISAALPQILYAGLLSSGVAFVLQVVGQRYTTSPQAAIFLSSEALFGALFGAWLLGETLPTIGYIGCATLFSAMLLVELVPEVTRRRVKNA
ncbi:DMT family transporter [Rhizobium sp. CG5]|uniref:DMT family transporter n=1 Tax=Rhizobium sp. CG5 TaxID=2726076 RepID=UPI002034577D|nr:DMT family transporter [Rhizobium sp. CG5]MCM2477508.1 DMT family transporter [Rhizobium sp. CG5]